MKKANPDLVEAIKRCLGQTDEALTADRIFDLVSECDSLPAMAYTLNWMRNNGIIEGEPTGKRGAKNVPVMAYRLLTVQTPPQNTSPAEALTHVAADGSARGGYVVNGKTVNAVPSRASAVSDTGNMVELVMVKESPEKAPEKSHAAQPSAASAAAVKKTREGLAADAVPATSAADQTGDLMATTAADERPDWQKFDRSLTPRNGDNVASIKPYGTGRPYASGEELRAEEAEQEVSRLRLDNLRLAAEVEMEQQKVRNLEGHNRLLEERLGDRNSHMAYMAPIHAEPTPELLARAAAANEHPDATAYREQLEDATRLIESLREGQATTSRQLADTEHVLADSMTECTRLTNELSHQRNLVESWQESARELGDINSRLGCELSEVKAELETARGQVKYMGVKSGQDSVRIGDLEVEVDNLRLDNIRKADAISSLSAQLADTKAPSRALDPLTLTLDAEDLAKIGEQINASLAQFHEQLKDGMEVVGKAWAAAIEQMKAQMANIAEALEALPGPAQDYGVEIKTSHSGVVVDTETIRRVFGDPGARTMTEREGYFAATRRGRAVSNKDEQAERQADAARYAGETCQRRQELLDAEFKDVVKSVETLGLDYHLGRVVEFLAEGRASDGVNQVWALKRAQALLHRYVSQLEDRA